MQQPVKPKSMSDYKGKIIAVDFDGTCVRHEYPDVGGEIGAPRVLHKLAESGAKFILWTIRSGPELGEAIMWFHKHKIKLYGVNQNPTQISWSTSPKAYAHIYIDDAAMGTPLVMTKSGSNRPYVDWEAMDRLLFPAK